MKQLLGIEQAQETFADAMDSFRAMAGLSMDRELVVAETGKLFVPGWSDLDQAERDKIIARATSPVGNVIAMASGGAVGSDLEGANGTVWGWLNAVTEQVDHHSRTRTAENRFASGQFGNGAAIKQQALQQAVAMSDGSYKYVPKHRQIVTDAADGAALLESMLAC